jgi:multifunctional methyltransferase subunit TRM112
MRLLTHNLLSCIKCQSFPLDIAATEVEAADADYDVNHVRRMLARLDYGYLVKGLDDLKATHADILTGIVLPAALTDDDLADDESAHLRAVHEALNAIAVKNGTLSCPKCAAKFAVKDFIPNMMVD